MNVIKAIGFSRGKKISEMKVGQSGFTYPWAYDPDTNVLNEPFPIYGHEEGTASMFVIRRTKGYEVDARGFVYL